MKGTKGRGRKMSLVFAWGYDSGFGTGVLVKANMFDK